MMKKSSRSLDLNFATPHSQYSIVVLAAIGIVVMSIVVSLGWAYHQVTEEISLHAVDTDTTEVRHSPPKHSASLDNSIQLAHQTEAALNLPWSPLLDAIELAKQDNPNIALLSIDPNHNRAEVTISGLAPDFNAMMGFLKSLKEQPALGESTLLNQHWQSENDKRLLSFTLATGWKN